MHIRKLTALTLAVIMLAGCSEIDYSSVASDGSADTSSNGETSVPQASIVTENKTKEYKINKSNFSYVLEAEKTEGTKLISDDRKYSGEGYITVDAYKSVTFDMEVPSTQFYDIAINALSNDGGSITLDGESIYDIPKKKLRGSIGIVLQDTVIFNDTIMQNIRYGRLDATDEEVIAAAKTAKAADFAEKMADGYETMLTEGGGNLRQGQRQLIAIARAVLADPKILILDEATSSIDTRTEVHIQEAMLALMKGRTSLIIAHRLSTIRDADKIVVIDGGKVVEAGNHEKLLSENGSYARLYNTQFAGIKT